MSDIVIYQQDDGSAVLEVHLEQETVWLSQAQLVALFQRDQPVLSRHIRNVFNEGELEEKSNMQKMHIANSDRPVAGTFYQRKGSRKGSSRLMALPEVASWHSHAVNFSLIPSIRFKRSWSVSSFFLIRSIALPAPLPSLQRFLGAV